MTKLQSFRNEGDPKNFNFDKYMNLHIEQHNQHADLQEYRVAPLVENLKTLWFQDGIRDPSPNAVKASINANHANFTDYDSVKDTYVEFKRTENPTNDPRTRQVASVARGGRRGGSFPRKHDCRQGPQTFDKCQKVLVPQSEVDKQTHIVDQTIQMPSLTDCPLLRNKSYGSLGMSARPQGLDQLYVTPEGLLP